MRVVLVLWLSGVLMLACGRGVQTQPHATAAPEVSPTSTPDATPSSTPEAPKATVIHVVSFNLLHGFPSFLNLDQRTQMVVDWIDANQPDLIAVQEIGQTPDRPNRAQVIAEATGYDWTWEKASGYDFVFEEGPGILSRWPIVSTDGTQLPHSGVFEIRTVSSAVLELPSGERLTVGSTHISGGNGSVVNAEQAIAAWQFTAAAVTEVPGILAGDMNAGPNSLNSRVLRGEEVHNGVTGNLIDPWLETNPNDPGFTDPATDPDDRIDYLYVVPGTNGDVSVQTCEIIFDQPSGAVYASDHLGVACRIELPLPR